MTKQDGRVLWLLVGSFVFVAMLAALGYTTRRDRSKSLAEWIDEDSTIGSVAVGLIGGVVFGVIDNVMLFAGISALDEHLRMLPFGDETTMIAGYGNAITGGVSALAATFAGRAIADLTNTDLDNTPLWATSVGFVIGGTLGILGPRLIVGHSA